MKISASVYSQKNKSLETIVKELDKHHIDYFHIDCNDDVNVFEDIKAIKNISTTPIDLHIISNNPEKYVELINESKIEHVTFQYENLSAVIPFKKFLSCKIGLAIVSETPIDVYEQYKDNADFLLFMTTTPGKSGGTFNKENFKKIRKFRAKYPQIPIHVDGGVNAEVSFVLRNMGVDSAVVGSYLFNQDYIGEALINLHLQNTTSHFVLSDFMIGKEECPIISYEENSSLLEVLQAIEHYKLGFATVIDSANKLIGLISNADVRKGLIKHFERIATITLKDIINTQPLVIQESKTINDLITLIKQQQFPVLYIPVVNEQQQLTGVLTFNNLIKGES